MLFTYLNIITFAPEMSWHLQGRRCNFQPFEQMLVSTFSHPRFFEVQYHICEIGISKEDNFLCIHNLFSYVRQDIVV